MAIAFANLLSKTSYGTYQSIMSIAAILGGLTLSMAIPVKKAVAQGNDGALRFGFHTQLLWSVGIFIVAGIISAYYFYNDNQTLGKSLLVIGTLTPLIGSFSLYRSYLLGKKKFQESAILGLWLRPVLIVTILVALYFTNDPFILILVYFTTSTLSTGFLYFLTVSKYKLQLIPDFKGVNYAKHLSVLGVISTIGNHAEKLFIFHFLGPAQVAIYSIAMLPSTHILGMYTTLSELIFPKFARRTYTSIKQGILNKIGIVFLSSVLVVGLFIVTAPYIYKIVFPAYPEAVLFSQLASLAILTKFGNLFTQVFYAHEMKKELYFIRVFSIVVKIVLLFILIPKFGILGAVISWLVFSIIWTLSSGLIFFTKKLRGEAKPVRTLKNEDDLDF